MGLDEVLQARGGPPEALAEARRRGSATGRSLVEVLVEMGELDEVEAARAEAEALGVEFLETVTDDLIDPDLVERLPVEWARAHRALPIRRAAVPRR
jgi:general secretion pathway protein E